MKTKSELILGLSGLVAVVSIGFLLGRETAQAVESCEIDDPVVQAHADLVKLEAECEAKGGLVMVAPGTSRLRLELIEKYQQAMCF